MAVYTEVTDEDLEDFLSQYELGEMLSLKGIAEGVENSNYLLHTTTGSYILTLYEKRVRAADLPFFLGLMQHVAAGGFPCPTPVPGKDGEALRRLKGRPAAIITYLEGLWPRRIKPWHCRQLGEAVARFHRLAQDFPLRRENDLSVAGWRPLFEACGARSDEVAPGLCDFLARELDFLEANWPQDLPAGVIHADLFPDNVFFLGDELSGFIDFYFACNDLLAYDLAICLNAWCFEDDKTFNATKARKLIQGYGEARALSREELEALPILARGGAVRFLLTRLYDLLNHPEGAYVTPKDPLEYLARCRFHQEVTGPAAYGLSCP